MKSIFLTAIFSAISALSASAVTLGGVDPGTAVNPGSTDGTSTNFTVISDQFKTTTGAGGLTIDLAASTFSYQSTSVAASALPFLAVQNVADSHAVGDYDVIWMGTSLANNPTANDVSAPLGAGTLLLPANSTIVGGWWSTAASRSPVSYSGGVANDVLIVAQTDVSVAGDIAVTGNDWSAAGGVNNRLYAYQIDITPIPEPSAGILLVGIAGASLMARRRRK